MILVVPILWRMIKSINKNGLIRVSKTVFNGMKMYQNHYWIKPFIPPEERNEKVNDAIQSSVKKCLEISRKNGGIEVAFFIDKKGVMKGHRNGTNSRVSIGPDFITSKQGVLVHNHPKGTSFSLEDIEVYFVHSLHEILVAHETWLYRFRADKRLHVGIISRYEDKLNSGMEPNEIMESIGKMQGVYYERIRRA